MDTDGTCDAAGVPLFASVCVICGCLLFYVLCAMGAGWMLITRRCELVCLSGLSVVG